MDILIRIVLGGALLVVLRLGLKMARNQAGRGVISGYNVARATFQILLGLTLAWYVISPQTIPNILTLELPNELQFISFLVCISGMVLRGWCQHVLGKQWSADISLAQDHTLVTWGPYGVIRHPMYASYLLIAPSLFALTGNWLVGIFAGSYAILSILRIPAEERLLHQHFGQVYEDYRLCIGRLFPLFR